MNLEKLKKNIYRAKLSLEDVNDEIVDELSNTFELNKLSWFLPLIISQCITSGCSRGCQVACHSGNSSK